MINKCINCKDTYSTTRRTQKFCTNICYLVFRRRYKTQADLKDGTILRKMWNQYHSKRNNYDEIIALMYREKFTSNKNYDTYDLFIPNNLKND